MRAVIAAVVLSACGRIGFDATAIASARDGAMTGDDGAMLDDSMIAIDAGLPAGLVAWYPFEGTITSKDVIANNDGGCSMNQCPSPMPGHLGQGLQFDGVDDCLSVGDAGQLDLPQITLAIWANQATTGTLSQVSKRVLGGSVNSWQLETEALGTPPLSLSFTTYDGSGLNQYARTPMNTMKLGTWQHLAATYDGATKRVYIDGVEQATVAEPNPLPYDNMPMMIGCDDNNPVSEYYNGVLDDLQIYDRALTPTEIADLAAR
ncbi:MAG TPA: LamG domain-containing protein [Kofleriaceae bacterium]|jgi:hypothetical protein|nr:LamG domain-containing protein [Kofleriaceae bacterium]